MTDDEAEKLLKVLSIHYKQPVMPIGRYCDALKAWFAIVARNPQRFRWAEHVPSVLLSIRKSNLLFRMLYRGEKLREQRCPQHGGNWVGVRGCEHGCLEVGWLPEPHPFNPGVLYVYAPDEIERRACATCGGVEGAAVHSYKPMENQ